MKYLSIMVRADTNDGDYVVEVNKISEADLEKIKPIIVAIKANNGIFETHELASEPLYEVYTQFTEEEMEFFGDFVPSGMYGVHSIDRIEVCPYVKKERLL